MVLFYKTKIYIIPFSPMPPLISKAHLWIRWSNSSQTLPEVTQCPCTPGRQTLSSSSCQSFRGSAFEVKLPGNSSGAAHGGTAPRAPAAGRRHPLGSWQGRRQRYGDKTPRAAPQRAAEVSVHCAEVTKKKGVQGGSGFCCLIFSTSFH